MPVTDSGAVTRRPRKHRPILQVSNHSHSHERLLNRVRFGGTIQRLIVGPHNRRLSAHEDVLCACSTFSSNRFQDIRKVNSGECTICRDELEMTETGYCRSCCQNFHANCMRDWLKTNNTCPTCRTTWRRLSDLETSTLDHLDPDGFEVYVQWLYSQPIPHYTSGTTSDCVVRLLKAHIVGTTVGDSDFLHAVRNKIVEAAVRAQAGISNVTIDFTYKNTHEPCVLPEFMVDLYALTGSLDSLNDAEKGSRLLLFDMAQSFIKKSKPCGEVDVWCMMATQGYIELEDKGDQP